MTWLSAPVSSAVTQLAGLAAPLIASVRAQIDRVSLTTVVIVSLRNGRLLITCDYTAGSAPDGTSRRTPSPPGTSKAITSSPALCARIWRTTRATMPPSAGGAMPPRAPDLPKET